jgi:CheY-like chemotaxis protein
MSGHDPTKIDFFEVGDKTALIAADPAVRDVVGATLRDLGFKFHTADTGEMAVERMRYNQYDCIAVQDNFAGTSLRSNVLLSHIAPLPMALRRHSFVCLIGSSLKTLDAMQAFAESVHLVVNSADLPNLTAILKKGLLEFETRYRVYNEVVAAQGKR